MSGASGFDPRKLDVAALASAQAELAGEWPLSAMPRLMQDAWPSVPGPSVGQVRWSARGERRGAAEGHAETWLHLQAHTSLTLGCQRCLQPVVVTLQVQPSLRFVVGEAQAQQLDEDSEDDVLALEAALDLQQLVEDELILALPLVPRHDHCELPLTSPLTEAPEVQTEVVVHPFAGLAALRRNADAEDCQGLGL